jgi:soluble lytic murein transglycosylase-like protein
MSLAEILCAAYISLSLPNANVACKHMDTVVSSASEHDVDPTIMISLIHVESRWTPTARSQSNACGLTQIIPKYSGGYRNRFGQKLTCQQLYDPETSIKRGTKILSYYLKRYDGNHKRSLCSYNAGWTRCKKPNGTHKGYKYALRVMKLSSRLQRLVDSSR